MPAPAPAGTASAVAVIDGSGEALPSCGFHLALVGPFGFQQSGHEGHRICRWRVFPLEFHKGVGLARFDRDEPADSRMLKGGKVSYVLTDYEP